tara:strand:- start:8885 stop:9067 length:183 start_codon:yes stop_codon:yes gene_type:complete
VQKQGLLYSIFDALDLSHEFSDTENYSFKKPRATFRNFSLVIQKKININNVKHSTIRNLK